MVTSESTVGDLCEIKYTILMLCADDKEMLVQGRCQQHVVGQLDTRLKLPGVWNYPNLIFVDKPVPLRQPPPTPSMSAPQIPNLNTLRRGGGRGRGRGRSGPGDARAIQETLKVDKDKIVQSTDLDAATARLSAVEAGYLDDPYAKFMVPGGHADTRLPLMNRGSCMTCAS